MGERVENWQEIECQEQGRRLFRVVTKSGVHDVKVKDNYSRVLRTKKVS